MNESTISILTMLGTWVSGIGTVAAVIYAINVAKPKVKIFVSEIESSEDGGFVLDVTNTRNTTAYISHIRLVESNWFQFKQLHRYSIDSMIVPPKGWDMRLDKEILPSGYERFTISNRSVLEAYCLFCNIREPKGMMRMAKGRIAVFLNNGSVVHVPLPKSQYQKMKNLLLSPYVKRVEELQMLGVKRSIPNTYSEEQKNKIVKHWLDEYEYALKRNVYLELPYGVKEQHYINNV